MQMKCALALLIALFLNGPAFAASVDGLAIRSTVQGEGKTIIFVHGWTCDESSWDAQVDAFMHDYRVVTIDLPGHGASETPTAAHHFTMDLFAAAVEAVLAEIGADKVVLVGHSMGASVIRKYATNHPDRVAGLVSADGSLDQRMWSKGAQGQQSVTRPIRAALIEGMFVETTPPELRDRIRTMMMRPSAITAQGAGDAMIAPDATSSTVILAPALSIWAENYVPYPDFDTRDILPNWEESRMPGTGHFLMMEQPEIFNALLSNFIKMHAQF